MKLMVTFDGNIVRGTVVANTILAPGVPISVERARIDRDSGWILLDLDEEVVKGFIESLKQPGVTVEIQQGEILQSRTECVDCGLCISICPKNVFSFDDSWRLQINSKFCVLCGQCVIYCPQRALSLKK